MTATNEVINLNTFEMAMELAYVIRGYYGGLRYIKEDDLTILSILSDADPNTHNYKSIEIYLEKKFIWLSDNLTQLEMLAIGDILTRNGYQSDITSDY